MENKMPRKMKDLTGLWFGRLRVIKEHGRMYGGKEVSWLCECSCGVEEDMRRAIVESAAKFKEYWMSLQPKLESL